MVAAAVQAGGWRGHEEIAESSSGSRRLELTTKTPGARPAFLSLRKSKK